ncbi:Transposase, Sph21_1677 family [hydrothermal vent metagenome]|uniref:Transposase, Sph21_1677 family n=1 Tax=hydrothermal vent metagenome TaxID=652676 RepID=A0A3B0UAA5_9ZZZZ
MNKSNNFSGQPIIKQLLKLTSLDIVSRTVASQDSDRYYKRFKTYDHLVTMLYATLSGVSSLQELSTVLLACEGRIGHLNLKYFPKRSTLSDANKNRSGEVFANIYYSLFNKYRSFLSDSGPLSLPIKHLKIVDSTTISLFSDILNPHYAIELRDEV